MKKISLLIMVLMLFFGCTTMTTFNSKPSGAKVYLNDEYIGKTPVTIELSNLVLNNYVVKFKLDGYDVFTTTLVREAKAGPIIAGVCTGILPIALWGYGPKANYDFEMEKGNAVAVLIIDKKSNLRYFLDGNEIFETENYVVPGEYSLRIKNVNDVMVDFAVQLEPNFQYKLSETL